MDKPRIVIDSNVIVSALRSSRGASRALMALVGTGRFEISVSVALVLEYEAAAKRRADEFGLTANDVDDVIDYLCSVAEHCTVFYLWRPFLPDPQDDMVLEVAVAGGCGYIVTHNTRDFSGSEQFGVRAVSPKEFLVEPGAVR